MMMLTHEYCLTLIYKPLKKCNIEHQCNIEHLYFNLQLQNTISKALLVAFYELASIYKIVVSFFLSVTSNSNLSLLKIVNIK